MGIQINFVESLKNKSPEFTALDTGRQLKLNSIITQSLFGTNRHRFWESYTHIGSSFLDSKYLKKSFGNEYKKVIKPFFKDLDQPGMWEYYFLPYDKKGYGKRYQLRSWVKDVYEEFCNDPSPIELLNHKHDPPRKVKTIPGNGIHKKDIHDLPIKSNIWIDPVVPVNMKAIDDFLAKINIKLATSTLYQKEKLEKVKFNLLAVKRLANNVLTPGNLIQTYQEHTSGRLNGQGFHLLYQPKIIRYIVFSGMNLYDYDISNCHYRMFYELTKKYGYICKNIDYYLKNKKHVRQELSQITSKGEAKVKAYLISLIYGSNAKQHTPFNSNYENFGKEGLQTLYNHPVVKGIHDELLKGGKIILNNTQHRGNSRGTTLLNTWNKGLQLYDEQGKKVKKPQMLSHLLNGWESKILDYINTSTEQDFTLLCYDGWISSKIEDISAIVSIIKSEPIFAVDIEIEVESITEPSIDDILQRPGATKPQTHKYPRRILT